MKNIPRFRVSMALALALLLVPCALMAQGTAFTYQGKLMAGGQPANGGYDILFSLYNAASGGAQVGPTVTKSATGVTNGLFTAALDFGPTPYNGQALWLQVAVSPAGSNTFTALSPLQPLTSTPYAVAALNAGSAAALTGTITVAQLPASVVTNGATNVSISGSFSGNGGGLTNLSATQLSSGTISSSLLPSNVLMTVQTVIQTNVYSSAGITTVIVPAGATNLTAKLWGGGGGGSIAATGGAGAFVQQTLSVVPGQIFKVVVGQHGNYFNNGAGGTGSGDAAGGLINPATKAGQGGQASSLFYFTGTNYVTAAVAGGGGGAGLLNATSVGGAGGNPGQAGASGGGAGGSNGFGGAVVTGGTAGDNYATGATTTGIASPGSADGNGGAATASGGNGGGGGGFGGGGTGGSSGLGGGGGGSYGAIVIGGTNNNAGNTGDPSYISPNGAGGPVQSPGIDGLVVITFSGFETTTSAGIAAASFTGSGANLTNLNAASLVGGTISSSVLPTNLFTTVQLGVQTNVFQTNVYSAAGSIVVTVPANATLMTAKLWGAGGSGGHSVTATGGAGGFVQQSINVVPGQTFLVVVGQHGNNGNNNAGGSGSGDAEGGAGPGASGTVGQGGQASSLFYVNGINYYVTKAVAGGGGGGGFSYSAGAGGNPGQSGLGGPPFAAGGTNGVGGAPGNLSFQGGNYAIGATNAGISSPSLANGNGGAAAPGGSAGGGGGGFGGGGGGNQNAFGGGGGGGSYGAIIIGGNLNVPGNTADPSYVAPNATGGAALNPGADGLVVLTFGAVQTTAAVYVTAAGFTGDGSGLTNLSLAQLPAAVLTNQQTGVTLGGTFTGNGAGLTNVSAASPSGVALLAGGNTFTGASNIFNGSIGIGTGPQALGIPLVVQGSGNANQPQLLLASPGGLGTTAGELVLAYLTNSGAGYGLIQSFKQGVGSAPLAIMANNVGIGTNAPAYPLQMASGAYCSLGGVWTSVSDRDVKEDFKAIAPGEVLAKLVGLPITQWKYKVEQAGLKHIGPVAQDFHAAFGLGDSDRAIGTVDESGVALAAIQGLNQKLEATEKTMREKDAEIQALQARLEKLEHLINAKNGATR